MIANILHNNNELPDEYNNNDHDDVEEEEEDDNVHVVEEEDDDVDDDDSTTVTTSSTIYFRSFLIRLSQFIGLTPNRSLLLHILLIGYPFQYGILPMGILYPNPSYLSELSQTDTKSIPCHILFSNCPTTTVLEYQSLSSTLRSSLGLYSMIYYELLGVLWFFFQSTTTTVSTTTSMIMMTTFHQLVFMTSFGTLLLFYLGQGIILSFSPGIIQKILFCYGMACMLSVWTFVLQPQQQQQQQEDNKVWNSSPIILTNTRSRTTTITRPTTSTNRMMKWSIPANSIFYAAVIQLFIALQGFQTLLETWYHHTSFHPQQQHPQQHDQNDWTTSTVYSSSVSQMMIGLGYYYMFLHAVLLLRIRTFLQVSQLRWICFYQLMVQLFILVWMKQDQNDDDHHHTTHYYSSFTISSSSSWWSILLTITTIIGYLNGFLWAGRAEGIGQILSGEKED